MELAKFITSALEEDIGDGDHTSLACIPASSIGKARLIVKENCVIAGVELAEKIFRHICPEMNFTSLLQDGNDARQGDVAFFVNGNGRHILAGERLVLNCMQRMSGIATVTRKMADQVKGTRAKLLDTRKTTPGFRAIEKWAVRIGGGFNHRQGLFDMILVKDNHVDYAGGIANAILSVQNYIRQTKKDLKVEIEARNLREVKEILKTGMVHRIMLDNFSVEQTREAVGIIGGKYEIETSGNITLERIREYAECGVDYISVGALTHSIKSIDLSLKAFK